MDHRLSKIGVASVKASTSDPRMARVTEPRTDSTPPSWAPAWIEVDLDVLVANARVLRNGAPQYDVWGGALHRCIHVMCRRGYW